MVNLLSLISLAVSDICSSCDNCPDCRTQDQVEPPVLTGFSRGVS